MKFREIFRFGHPNRGKYGTQKASPKFHAKFHNTLAREKRRKVSLRTSAGLFFWKWWQVASEFLMWLQSRNLSLAAQLGFTYIEPSTGVQLCLRNDAKLPKCYVTYFETLWAFWVTTGCWSHCSMASMTWSRWSAGVEGTSVSQGATTTWDRSLEEWVLQIACFEDFVWEGIALGLIPSILPQRPGCAYTLSTTPLLNDWTTLGLYNGNKWRKCCIVPRAHPFVPFFYTCSPRSGNKGALDFQGRHGITSVVQTNLSPVIFTVELLTNSAGGSFLMLSGSCTTITEAKCSSTISVICKRVFTETPSNLIHESHFKHLPIVAAPMKHFWIVSHVDPWGHWNDLLPHLFPPLHAVRSSSS